MKSLLRIVSVFALFFATQSTYTQLITLESQKHFETLMHEMKPMVLDFYATWCGVCKRAEPMVMQLARQHGDVNFIKIDGDKFPALRDKYHVRAFPTFVFLDANDNQMLRVEGMDNDKMMTGLTKLKAMAQPMSMARKSEAKPMPKPAMPVEIKKPEPKKSIPMPMPEKKAPAMEKNLVELKSMQHLEELRSHGKPMMLDVYTTWCGPCKLMHPIIEELANEYNDVIFVKVDAEGKGLESLRRKYKVEAYPTFIFMDKSGKEVDRHRGSADKMLMKCKLGKISSKKSNVIIMDEKDMMAKMQSEKKMMQQPMPQAKPMKAVETTTPKTKREQKAMEKQMRKNMNRRARKQ